MYLRRTVLATVLGVAILGSSAPGGLALPSPGAAADGTVPRTVSSAPVAAAAATLDSVTLSGRGFGHGRGMSQYGAYGAATRGLSTSSILSFYYPGTSTGSIGDPYVRVRLDALGSGGPLVVNATGLTISNAARTSGTSSTSTTDRYRVIRDGAGLTLQRRTNGVWVTTGVTQFVRSTSPIVFSNSSLQVKVQRTSSLRTYRGSLSTTASGAGIQTVNRLSMQNYLKSVVPSEMPTSWSSAAVQAQSVAARTYAERYRTRQPSGSTYDICDTTSCQVYNGYADYTLSGTTTRVWEDSRGTAAVTATAGQIRTSGGVPILAEFGSSNGGRTVSSTLAYQVTKDDPYDGASPSGAQTWQVTVSGELVERAYPQIGALTSVTVTARYNGGTWGGRVSTVVVSGTGGSATVSGGSFRAALGLRSDWFTVTSTS